MQTDSGTLEDTGCYSTDDHIRIRLELRMRSVAVVAGDVLELDASIAESAAHSDQLVVARP